MLSLKNVLSVGHGACQLNTLHSATGNLLDKAERWQHSRTTYPIVREVVARALCAATLPTALCEATLHLIVALGILTTALLKRITVTALAVLSWAITVGHVFVMNWLLDVSKVNWCVRILTEIGVLVTKPWMFASQWKERITVIFWASTRDRWIWNISNTIEKQFQQFLEFSHGWHHIEKAGAFAAAAVMVPATGIISPERAQRRFAKLGIEPPTRLQRFYHKHGNKIALIAAVGILIACDYKRRDCKSLQEYTQHMNQASNTYLRPHWDNTKSWGQWFGRAVYNQIFYERIDNSLINRKNRALAEAAETWTADFEAKRVSKASMPPWLTAVS